MVYSFPATKLVNVAQGYLSFNIPILSSVITPSHIFPFLATIQSKSNRSFCPIKNQIRTKAERINNNIGNIIYFFVKILTGERNIIILRKYD
jgi:hypothetical protein